MIRRRVVAETTHWAPTRHRVFTRPHSLTDEAGRRETEDGRETRSDGPTSDRYDESCTSFFLLLFQTRPRSRPRAHPVSARLPGLRFFFFSLPADARYGTCQAGLLVPDGNPAASPRTLSSRRPTIFFLFFFPSHQPVGALVAELLTLTTTRSPVSGMPTT